jgi:hypothetical protein
VSGFGSLVSRGWTRAANGAAFSPADIPDLELWVAAKLGVTLTSGRVSGLADQHSKGYDFGQSNASFRPEPSTALGHQSILFTSANSERLLSTGSQTVANWAFLHSGPITIVAAVRPATVHGGCILGTFNNAGAVEIGFTLNCSTTGTGNLAFFISDGSSFVRGIGSNSSSLPSGTTGLVVLRHNASGWDWRVNGAGAGSGSTAVTLPSANPTRTPTIGDNGAGTRYFNGHQMGQLVYSRYLSLAEVETLEAYATAAWLT